MCFLKMVTYRACGHQDLIHDQTCNPSHSTCDFVIKLFIGTEDSCKDCKLAKLEAERDIKNRRLQALEPTIGREAYTRKVKQVLAGDVADLAHRCQAESDRLTMANTSYRTKKKAREAREDEEAGNEDVDEYAVQAPSTDMVDPSITGLNDGIEDAFKQLERKMEEVHYGKWEFGGKRALLDTGKHVGRGTAVGLSNSKDTFDAFGRQYKEEMQDMMKELKKDMKMECEKAVEARIQAMSKDAN